MAEPLGCIHPWRKVPWVKLRLVDRDGVAVEDDDKLSEEDAVPDPLGVAEREAVREVELLSVWLKDMLRVPDWESDFGTETVGVSVPVGVVEWEALKLGDRLAVGVSVADDSVKERLCE